MAAYTPRRISTPSGVAFERWADSSFPIVWRISTAPSGSNITGARSPVELVRLSTQAWNSVETAQVSFSEGSSTPIASAAFDQINLISFAPAGFVSDAAAVTVLYSFAQTGTDSFGRRIQFPGQILEADILFNPAVPFSTDGSATANRIDLQSQITHEIGHLLGLDHSGLASAVMFPVLVPGAVHLRTLSTDDMIGVSTLYPNSAFWNFRAGIRGVIRSPANTAAFGAHIVIVDASGRPVVSAVSDPDGNYQIQGLEPGNYSAYAEPLDGPAGATAMTSFATAYPNSTVGSNFTTRFAVQSVVSALSLTKTGGENQTGNAGEALSTPLEVQVRDSNNAPVAGVIVNFAAASGGGAVVPLMATTDQQGKARTTAYLGQGQNQQFTASAGGTSVGFPATRRTTISSITLTDLVSGSPLKELVVNAGQTIQAQTRVVDSTGAVRTNVPLTFTSSNAEVAGVDNLGNIQGKKAGFSTLVMSESGGLVSTATVTVVEVASGSSPLATTGIAQDPEGKIYMAATQDHTIRLAAGVTQSSAIYAGATGAAGLVNGTRAASRFKNPTFLAVDSGTGAVYVSDSGNNVIRKITPSSDSVEIFAGSPSGVAGNADGPAAAATFNNPQGIALDNAGYLWVADSGNHTIRRIGLASGNVETIAGSPLSPGLIDNTGNAARFTSPLGIAFQPETLTGQLDRYFRGGGAPPVWMVVADTGNGAIRRVRSDGLVQTIGGAGAALMADGPKPSGFALTNVPFDSPAGIAVDRFGTIYVSEPAQNRVKVILTTGEVILLAQPGTSQLPKGLLVDELGHVLLAESGHGVQKVEYGSPEITQVTPTPVPGSQITIKGTNFAPDTVSLAEGFPNTQGLVPDVTVAAFHTGGSMSPANPTMTALGVGAELTLTATFGGTPTRTLTWTSSNTSVATVEGVTQGTGFATGKVVSVANGTATIAVKQQFEGSEFFEFIADTMVTVAQAVDSVAIATPATMTALGNTQQLIATAKDSNQQTVPGKTFSWSSSATDVVSVNTAGVVTAVANGTATITASVDGKSGTGSVAVVQAVSSVIVTPSSPALTAVGATQAFAAEAKDANGNAVAGKSFTWTSSAGGVATITSPGTSGLATAVANGTSTITASVDGKTGTATLTVSQTVSTIAVSPANPTLTEIGATQQFSAAAKDANNYDIQSASFAWSSSNTAAATISASGLATAVANGTATITATSGGISGTTQLTVNQSLSPVVSTVTVSPSTATIASLGATQEFSAVARNAAGVALSGKTFTWTSSVTGVATITSPGTAGLATAAVNGTATITASVDGVSGTAALTVAQEVSSVVVSPGTAVLTAIGTSQQFTATARDARDNPISGKTFAWTSASTGVATVGASTGLAAAVANGSSTITASVDGKSGTAALTVAQAVSSITVTPGSPTLGAFGATQQFSAVARDANGNAVDGKNFTWTSSAGSIATIGSSSGLATAVANGSTTITGSADGVSGSATLTVAQAVATITVNPSTPTLTTINATQPFTALAKDSNAHEIQGVAFNWTSSSTAVATINATTGVATAVTNGSTTITATSGGISGTTILTVDENASPVVAGVTITPASASLVSFGATQQFTAVARNSAGAALSGKTFSWTSSATSVATITSAGLATAVANGTSTITASVDGISGTAVLSVAQAVSNVVVSPGSAVLTAVGTSQQFTAVARDARDNPISGKSFTWTSSSTGVAAIGTATGLTTAAGNGSATITATVDGIAGTASLTVAQTVSSVVVTPASQTLGALGSTQQFTAVARDANGITVSGKSFTWTSSASGVATIGSATGLAAAAANGTTTITGSTDGISGSATLTVAQAISTITVSPANPALTAIGATQQFSASAKDANGNGISNATFSWTSSAPAVAAINAGTGLATAAANGSATIIATAGSVSGTATLTVDENASTVVSSIAITPAPVSLTSLGAAQQFAAVAKNAAGVALTGKTFTWTSSAASVATMTSGGLATAVANGTATITASVDGISGTAALTVAQAVSSVIVNPGSAVLTAVGTSQQFTAIARDARDNVIPGKTFVWTSSSTGVATVGSSTGLATAAGNGAATISATADGIAGTASLTVGQTVSTVSITPASATLASLGATRQLIAVAKDANGNTVSGKTFIWTSSAVGVVSVNAAGLATAVTNGAATISASADGISGSASLTVTQTVATVSVDPLGTAAGFLGATQQFTAVAKDANANIIAGKTFAWTSSAPVIVTVNSTGLGTARAFGTANVSASVDGVSGSASFTVIQKLAITTFQVIDTETIRATVPASLTGPIGIGVLNRSGAFPWLVTPDGLK